MLVLITAQAFIFCGGNKYLAVWQIHKACFYIHGFGCFQSIILRRGIDKRVVAFIIFGFITDELFSVLVVIIESRRELSSLVRQHTYHIIGVFRTLYKYDIGLVFFNCSDELPRADRAVVSYRKKQKWLRIVKGYYFRYLAVSRYSVHIPPSLALFSLTAILK